MTTFANGASVLVRLPRERGCVPAIYVREIDGRHEVLLGDGHKTMVPGYRVRSASR